MHITKKAFLTITLCLLIVLLGYVYYGTLRKTAPLEMTPTTNVENTPQEEASIMSTSTVKQLTLVIGQSKKIDDFTLTLNSFVQDSRCPIDVQCIQAGAVTVNVTFSIGTTTITKNMPSDEVPQEFQSYNISITDVAPPRKSKEEVAPKDYAITFKITQD